jgi:hypothetical protein
MRVEPVLIMNSAGLWLFDSVWQEWMNAILSTCRAMCGKRSLTHVPLCPCCAQSNGDFISGPTASVKKPVLLSKPSSFFPSLFASSGL